MKSYQTFTHGDYDAEFLNRVFGDDPWTALKKPYIKIGTAYVQPTKFNNMVLGAPGTGFTAIDAAVNATWDAAGWPQRF